MNKTIILLIALITISLILFGCMEYDGDIPGFEREDEGTFTIKIDETLPETIDEQTLNTLNNEIDTTNRRLATNEELNITRRIASAPSEINDGHTTTFSITFENTTNTTLENIEIIEFIPKEIIANASMITSNQPFTIIEEDPIIMFTIPSLASNTTTKINYTFNRTKNQGPITQQQIPTIKSPTIIVPSTNGTDLTTDIIIGKFCTTTQECMDPNDTRPTCADECDTVIHSCYDTSKRWFEPTDETDWFGDDQCCFESSGARYVNGRPIRCCTKDQSAKFGINEYSKGLDEANSICCNKDEEPTLWDDRPNGCCDLTENKFHQGKDNFSKMKICCLKSLETTWIGYEIPKKNYTPKQLEISKGRPYCIYPVTGFGSGSGSGAGSLTPQQIINPQNILEAYGLFLE